LKEKDPIFCRFAANRGMGTGYAGIGGTSDYGGRRGGRGRKKDLAEGAARSLNTALVATGYQYKPPFYLVPFGRNL